MTGYDFGTTNRTRIEYTSYAFLFDLEVAPHISITSFLSVFLLEKKRERRTTLLMLVQVESVVRHGGLVTVTRNARVIV